MIEKTVNNKSPYQVKIMKAQLEKALPETKRTKLNLSEPPEQSLQKLVIAIENI
jgi:hypothetical protein